jgi:hypothetical protein
MRADNTRTVPATSSAGAAASRPVFGHVAHLAVFALAKPAVKVCRIVLQDDIADAERVESALFGQREEVALELTKRR